MNDNATIRADILFGWVELHRAPTRWEGATAILRGRIVNKDRFGNITSDVTYDTVSVENAGLWPQFFP